MNAGLEKRVTCIGCHVTSRHEDEASLMQPGMGDFSLLAGIDDVTQKKNVDIDLAFMPALTMLAPEACFQVLDVSHDVGRAQGRISSKAAIQEDGLVGNAHGIRAVYWTHNDVANRTVMMHRFNGRS